jgi:hypothetical protein
MWKFPAFFKTMISMYLDIQNFLKMWKLSSFFNFTFVLQSDKKKSAQKSEEKSNWQRFCSIILEDQGKF